MGSRRHSHDHDDEDFEASEPKTCPRCGSTDTRLSRKSRGVLTFLLTVLNMSRYRCRSCRRHFVGRN